MEFVLELLMSDFYGFFLLIFIIVFAWYRGNYGWLPQVLREFREQGGRDSFDGKYRYVYFKKDGTGYIGGVFNIDISNDGVYLEAPFLIKYISPPVLIPWNALRLISEKKYALHVVNTFALFGEEEVRIQIYMDVLSVIRSKNISIPRTLGR